MGEINLKTQGQQTIDGYALVTRSQRYSTIGSDLICARVAQNSNIKQTTVRNALLGIKEAVRYFVLNGHSVNLGKFGIISLSVSAQSVPQASQVSRDLIRNVSLKYNASTTVKEALQNISFTSK